MPTARHCLLATVAWLVTVGMLAWFGLGSFAITLIAWSAGLWIGAPLLLIGLVLGLARHRAGWRLVAGVLGLALTLGTALALGSRVCEWEVSRAKAAGSAILEACLTYHRREGRWPETLAELATPAPRLLRLTRPQDGSPALWIADPRRLMGAWYYDPETREWQFSD